jgi:putative oxidoreductase
VAPARTPAFVRPANCASVAGARFAAVRFAAARNPGREDAVSRAIYHLGRILMALIFLYSGYHKVADIGGTAAHLASKGLPLPEIFSVAAAAVEIAGGLMLGLGYRAAAGAAILFVYLIPVTLFFHSPAEKGQTTQFLKNAAIMGGLLVVVGSSDRREADD